MARSYGLKVQEEASKPKGSNLSWCSILDEMQSKFDNRTKDGQMRKKMSQKMFASIENFPHFSIPKGQATILVVGGALEALNGEHDVLRLVINRRKGFIKLAIRFGVDLVPTFTFGENSIYGQVSNPPGLWIKQICIFKLRIVIFTFSNKSQRKLQIGKRHVKIKIFFDFFIWKNTFLMTFIQVLNYTTLF